MDYEEKYKQALERVKSFMEGYEERLFDRDMLEDIFPELKESEDEKIRKWLIRLISTNGYRELESDPMPCNRMNIIYWLEKQKPVEKQIYWTEEEIEPIVSDYLCGRENYGGMIGRLRCLKPKQKQDEPLDYNNANIQQKDWADELKKCKENPLYFTSNYVTVEWKPSDEQLEALDTIYKTHCADSSCRRVVFNLLNDLKKLKGE